MVRRRQHPALMLQRLEEKRDTESRDIINSEVFRRLSGDDKLYFCNYLRYGDSAKALDISTLETKWLVKREKDPEFKTMMDKVMDLPIELAMLMMKEAGPRSAVIILELMEQDDNKDVKLRSAIHVQKTIGITDTDEFDVQNNEFNVIINHWDKPLPELDYEVPQAAIEGEVKFLDD